MKEKINQIITALFELEAKECHLTFFEYGNGLFRVRIIKRDTEKIVYEKAINIKEERKELKKMLKSVTDMRYGFMKVPYQCYKREFIKGVKSGEWEKTKSVIEYGKNAAAAKQIDGSGCFIDDFENGLQYYIDYKQVIEAGK
jgi:hypothetical protein